MKLTSVPRFITAIVIGLVCLGLIAFGITRLFHNDSSTKNTSSSNQNAGQEPQSLSGTDDTSTSTSSDQTNSSDTDSSTENTQQTDTDKSGATQNGSATSTTGTGETNKDLTKTGPAGTFAAFAGATAIGTLVAHFLQRRTAKSLQ